MTHIIQDQTPKRPGLLLLPNLLGETRHPNLFLPQSVDRAVASLDGLIAESEQGGRRFLGLFETSKPAHLIPLAIFNRNTPAADIDFLLEPVKKGERWGLVSDAGLPCISDPGNLLVARARQQGITVHAFVGPCSFTMALMLSGLPAQRFAFGGYIPKDKEPALAFLKQLEATSKQNQSTEMFMDAPHRNQETLELVVESLSPETMFSVAWNLTLPDQGVVTHPVKVWKKNSLPNIDKKPAVFLIGA